MKRWRVVHFPSVAQAEDYLNGLSIEPDQIRGMFAGPATSAKGNGVVLVCWLTAHQQRIEQLQRAPRVEDDLAPPADQKMDLPLPGPAADGAPDEPRPSRRRRREEDTD